MYMILCDRSRCKIFQSSSHFMRILFCCGSISVVYILGIKRAIGHFIRLSFRPEPHRGPGMRRVDPQSRVSRRQKNHPRSIQPSLHPQLFQPLFAIPVHFVAVDDCLLSPKEGVLFEKNKSQVKWPCNVSTLFSRERKREKE